MIIAALAGLLAAFYLGTMLGCWLTGKGRESAYLEGASDGIHFERNRGLNKALRDDDESGCGWTDDE